MIYFKPVYISSTKIKTHIFNPFTYLKCALLLIIILVFSSVKSQVLTKDGEPLAEDILNNTWKWPAYKHVPTDTKPDPAGFDFIRLGKVPKAGVHPRLLFSPDQLPAIKKRIETTQSGQLLWKNLEDRVAVLNNEKNWEYNVLQLLSNNDWETAGKILDSKPKPNSSPGHYQPYFIYELTLLSFQNLVLNNENEGKKVATAFYNYTKIIKAKLEETVAKSPWPEDVWRSGAKEVMDNQFIAYSYDFTYPFLTEQQRGFVRELLASYTKNKITFSMRLPPHFRNWNWINVSQSLALNVLAIEGEKGFDARVYKRCVDVMQSYMDYGISSKGSSKEAVGYTSFGFYWGCPAMIAMARRGDNLMIHPHFKEMKNWYVHSLQPYGKSWMSHGDGGDASMSVEKMMMMKYFYPNDKVIDYLWQNRMYEEGEKTLLQKMNILIPLICAIDPDKDANGKLVDYDYGNKLQLSDTFFDIERGSLNTRSGWGKNAAFLEFECRTDGVAPSHEHADRGNFTFTALGRPWTMDGFRGVETKYHNGILINGKGQGFFPTPGKWIKTIDKPEATFGTCDIKYSYDWLWPKMFEYNTKPGDSILNTARYNGFTNSVDKFQKLYQNSVFEKDPSPHVVDFYKDFEKGNPKMWDEDTWPVRIPYNPIQYAYRSAGLIKGTHPYVLIVDDIQKDKTENLYEWMLQLPWDLSAISISEDEIVLGTSSKDNGYSTRDRPESRKVVKGEPLLLVKIIGRKLPEQLQFDANPGIRVETFEKVNTQYGRDRSFGLDKRLVIPSLSVSPDFKIILYPYYAGDKLPTFTMKNNVLTVEGIAEKDLFQFEKTPENLTLIKMMRNGKQVF